MPWQGRTAQTKRPCLTTPPGNHLFYPRPPRGGRLSVSSIISGFSHISIHALREEGDPDPSGADSKAPNFYPRPPRGGRPRQGQQVRATTYFYPRPPRGGRLGEHHHTGGSGQFLSTPSARRATLPSSRTYLSESLFLSTPSARRATEGWEDALREALKFLSTPSARRATYRGFGPCTPSEISIHALREEGDDSKPLSLLCASWISIHALREEGDDAATLTLRAQIDFYPRPPRGGRQGIATDAATLTLISIHALREEGDGRTLPCCSVPGISIHALREEGDATLTLKAQIEKIFLSTPSARRATNGARLWSAGSGISIHALREEGDHRTRQAVWKDIISIHALREEGDTLVVLK